MMIIIIIIFFFFFFFFFLSFFFPALSFFVLPQLTALHAHFGDKLQPLAPLKPFMPHISLLYGVFDDPSVPHRILQDAGGKDVFANRTVRCSRVEGWITSGPPCVAWRRVCSFPLGGEPAAKKGLPLCGGFLLLLLLFVVVCCYCLLMADVVFAYHSRCLSSC